MVRRDEDGRLVVDDGEYPASCCVDPTGESPVSVSGDTPSSRLPARGEIYVSEAECRKPDPRRESSDGEQVRGPQHEVKTAASSHLQSEGRAAHFTAKAIPSEQSASKALAGVRVAARVQGLIRNTRDPSAQPSSRQGASYKPKAKSSTAQRKSEGTIVPPAPATKAAQQNAVGGKGPWGLVEPMMKVRARAWT